MEYINKSLVTYFIPHNHPEPIFPNVIIGRFGKYTVFINSDDPVPIPHFHICDSETFPKGDKFHCCLKILCSNYLRHTGNEDILCDEDLEALIEFLNGYKSSFGMPMWDYMIFSWNTNNPDARISKTTKMPDYNNL